MKAPFKLKLEAPAKVNLYLEVTGRRADGYHLLETLFARISLRDTLLFEPAKENSLRVSQNAPGAVPKGDDNLVLKAARAFQARFGGPGAKIRLIKRIPSGAGLGGGSSDAAAALLALARWTPAATRPLLETAARLGADVPFFMQPEPVALGRGIGERLRPVSAPKPPWMVAVFPGSGVSTAEAFRRLKKPPRSALTRGPDLAKILKNLKAGVSPAVWDRFLFNRLEEPVCKFWPETLELKRVFAGLGARSLLSGSGSCVFALRPDEASAKALARALRRKAAPAWKVYAARILD